MNALFLASLLSAENYGGVSPAESDVTEVVDDNHDGGLLGDRETSCQEVVFDEIIVVGAVVKITRPKRWPVRRIAST